MKKSVMLIIILLFIASCGTTSKNKTEEKRITVAYPLYVENYQFKKDGYTFLARGINVAGNWKVKREPAIYPYLGTVTEGTFRWLREELGYNFVRMLAIWAAIEPEENKFNEEYVREYARRVSWAAKYNMYVFVDMHQDVYSEAFYKYWGDGAPPWTCPARYYMNQPDMPTWEFGYLTGGPVACFKRFWTNEDNLWWHYGEAIRRILQPLADNDHVVGLEIMNEPFWGPWGPETFEEKYLHKFYLYMGEIIRKVAPRKIIFFEPAASRNLDFPTYLPPLPFPQLAYAPHFYPTDFFFGATYPGGMTDMIESALRRRIGDGIALNAVTIIGEFGAWVDERSTVLYLKDFFNAAERLQLNIVQWELTDVERKFKNSEGWSQWARDEWIKTVIRAYPEMWKGKLIRFKYYPDKFKLHIVWQAKGGDDMIITLPHYIFKGKCNLSPADNLAMEWINTYQIRVTAEKRGIFDFTVSR